MKKMQENYFIKTFEEAVEMKEEISYSLDFILDSKKVRDFSISNWTCSELFVCDEQFNFFKHAVYKDYSLDLEDDFNSVAYTLQSDEKENLLRTYMINATLVLQYLEKIVIINISSDTKTILPLNAKKITLGQKSLFVFDNTTATITEYDFLGTKIGTIVVSGTLIDMDYTDDLYFVVEENGQYHLFTRDGELESEYFETLDKEVMKITHFSMLPENDFIICNNSSALYYIDNENNTEELFFDKNIQMVETDCVGRIWVLSDNKLFRFKRDIKYKTEKSFFIKFNSFKEDTLWHSVVIDADIPKGTQIDIMTLIDNHPTKRHMNTPIFEKTTQHYINTKNILFYKNIGKKLFLKVTLYSDSTQQYTPKVYAVKSIFDKTSYLEYLPAYYKTEPINQNKPEDLYRFLSILQNIMDEIDATIDNMPQLLNLATTDDEFLTWLSQWLGIVRDYRWSQDKWRKFLMQAPLLYQKAGTKDGLSKLIELYSDEKPQIDEWSKHDENPFFFCVKIDADLDDLQVAVIETIVQEFKPAYTQAKVVINQGQKNNKNLILDDSVLSYSSVIN